MKTEWMREFSALGQCLNFSRAAELLYMNQSVLSRHIAAMEAELGTALLVRDTHSVQLTEAGKAALESYSAICAEEDRLTQKIIALNAGEYGTLRIGVTNLAMDSFFEDRLTSFLRRHPNVKTEIRSGHIEEITEAFRRREFDAALLMTSRPEIPDAYFYSVGTVPFRCACAEGSGLWERSSVDWSGLNGEILVFPPSGDYGALLPGALEEHAVKPKKIVKVENDNLIYHTMRVNGGISLIPQLMEDYPHRGIRILPFADDSFRMQVGFAFPRGVSTPAALLFLDSLMADET